MITKVQFENSIESEEATLDSQVDTPPQMMAFLSRGLPSLYRYANRLLRNQDDAEDAVQDALLSALKNWNQFRAEAQLSTWMTAIVINCARMQLRKRSRHLHLSLDSHITDEQEQSFSDLLVDDRPSPEDECDKSRLTARVMKSVAGLSPTLRRTFHLRYVDDLSLRETARILGVPIGTVKAQTARARAKVLNSIRRSLHTRSRSRRTSR